MANLGLQVFKGKRVLLLQGPVGPFFARLSEDLRHAGAEVFKVNFNAGDWLFYPHNAFNYQGSLEDWPDWFQTLIQELRIEVLLLFGDCRPVHQAAHQIAVWHELAIGVFEEGYVRPDYITLERFGVNGYSQIPRDSEFYKQNTAPAVAPTKRVKNSYWAMVWYGFLYFLAGISGKCFYPHYRHHRPMTLLEAFPWVRSVWRKQWYRYKERHIQTELTTTYTNQYFLIPLQVFNDTQIIVHADLESVEDFIRTTLQSFAHHAPKDTLLVFKHHPMDRGYRDYTGLIEKLARNMGIQERVRYIHDQHLPTLLDHARGVVVVNSTVGLSTLHHNTPTMVCGTALYDLPGLTWQKSLDEFWEGSTKQKPDPELYQSFRNHLIAKTQLNGSFYAPLKGTQTATGVIWKDSARIMKPIPREHLKAPTPETVKFQSN